MELYGAVWKHMSEIEIELHMIRHGGYFKQKTTRIGNGLFFHHKRLQSLLAPWKRWDRWSELILQNLIENRFTVLAGPANSTKTHNVAFYALCRYLAFPTNQCVLISSTDLKSLEMRIWGEIKKLWAGARQLYENCPGRIVESKQMIVTDISEDDATDYRNGIIGVPCIQSGKNVGLGKYCGIKNGNIFLAADELPFMSRAFYDGVSNLSSNAGFQGVGMGNPQDRMDVFGLFAEPSSEVGGWEGYEPTGKTFVIPLRFPGGKMITLDGRDTPNNEKEPDGAPPFPWIVTPEKIAEMVHYYGEDSIQVSSQFYGIFPADAQAKRVVTRLLCEQFRAMEEPIWTHDPVTKIFAIDAAYGSVGGDRCVGIEMHYGKCSDGVNRICFASNPMVIPVTAKSIVPAEDQIAQWVRSYCESPLRQIPPSHVALDSTGRGTLVSSFGRIWSTQVVPVEFGGSASERMVSQKMQVEARTYYLNMMSELWYRFRTLIESDQLRKLPQNVMEEFCMRGWMITKGNRIQVEPKDECKVRMGKSPDLADAAVVGLELAVRLGFQVIGGGRIGKAQTPAWLKDKMQRQKAIHKSHLLAYN